MADEIARVLALMQQMMKSQQEEMKQLREEYKQRETTSGSVATQSKGLSVDSLEKQIRSFSYNPDEGWTFEAWWLRHESIFNSVKLEDGDKSQMMLRHMEDTVFKQFRDHIRPKQVTDMTFSEVKEVMVKLFGDKKTIFEKRLEMFNLKMSKTHIEDMREFATRVNRVVEDADVSQLTPDRIKTMIFLAGVDLPRHTGAMFHIVNGMKNEESPTLEKILQIADSFKEAQLDSQTVTGQNRSQVNAVKKHNGKGKDKSQRDQSSSTDSENDECGRCGRDHDGGRCPFVNAICHKCNETGHIRVKCPGKNKGTKPKFNKIKSERSGNSSEFDVLMKANGKEVEMSVDSGSDLTFISQHTWKLVGSPRARCTNVTPECTNGSIFRVVGKCDVNLEMNGIATFGEVYITEDANVLGKDHMQFFFTLIPKRAEAQLNHSIMSIEVTEMDERLRSGTGSVKDHSRFHSMCEIEVTEVEETPHSGNGLVDENPRNHSIGGIEVTDMDRMIHSGNGQVTDHHDRSRSGSASTTRSSLKDDSTHSTEENIMVEEDTVAYCAKEKDQKIHTSEPEKSSSLMYELKQRVVTGSHSGLGKIGQMEEGTDETENGSSTHDETFDANNPRPMQPRSEADRPED